MSDDEVVFSELLISLVTPEKIVPRQALEELVEIQEEAAVEPQKERVARDEERAPNPERAKRKRRRRGRGKDGGSDKNSGGQRGGGQRGGGQRGGGERNRGPQPKKKD